MLDPFLGSGTTLIEAKRLGRNGLGVDLSPEAVDLAKLNVSNEENPYNVSTVIEDGDSVNFDFKSLSQKNNIKSVQFVIMHPPYWDIIKFSQDQRDLSNTKNIDDFLLLLGKITDNACSILDKGRYLALVIGDKYSQGNWIPLAFYSMNEIMKKGFSFKIYKN